MTLTDLSYYSRKFAPFVFLFLIVLLIFYFLIKLLLLSFQPAKTTGLYLNPIFGKIKKPIIKNPKASSNLNFTLDTIAGEPTTSTASANIYFLPNLATRFGYREKIYLIAKTLGFDTSIVKYKLEGKEAVFKDAKQTLQVDITNFNFTYEYNFEYEPQIFQKTIVPEKGQSEEKAVNFLKAVGRYPEELAKGKTNTVLISYNPEAKQLRIVDAGAGANMVEIDFYRPDLDEYPIVSPSYFNSQNYVMAVFYESDFKIIKAQIKFYERSEAQVGTYPLKTGDAAWESLKNRGGWVIQNQQNAQNIVIKKMFLGYLDPDIYQEYLQPVYVFLGENNFVAYVPAVSDDYFKE